MLWMRNLRPFLPGGGHFVEGGVTEGIYPPTPLTAACLSSRDYLFSASLKANPGDASHHQNDARQHTEAQCLLAKYETNEKCEKRVGGDYGGSHNDQAGVKGGVHTKNTHSNA